MTEEQKNQEQQEQVVDESPKEFPDIDIKLNGSYVPVLNELGRIWESKDIGSTIKKSILLMVFLTEAREQGYKMFFQDSNGNTKEMPILKSDDKTEDIRNIEESSLKELQQSFKV